MRIVIVLIGLLAIATLARPVHAQQDEYTDCFKASTDEKLYEKGIAVCTRLIKSRRWSGLDLARLYSNRGLLYVNLNYLDLAMQDFDEALGISPDYAYAYDNRGDVWRARKNYDNAIAEYNTAIRMDPTFISAYFNRGRTFLLMGNKKSARTDFQAVIDMPSKGRAVDDWAKREARRAINNMNTGN